MPKCIITRVSRVEATIHLRMRPAQRPRWLTCVDGGPTSSIKTRFTIPTFHLIERRTALSPPCSREYANRGYLSSRGPHNGFWFESNASNHSILADGSDRAVVLFRDTNVREGDFGVYKL